MTLSRSHRRRLAGLLCLFALVGGAIVSPTAHFAYMWGSMGALGLPHSEAHGAPEGGAAHLVRVDQQDAHGPFVSETSDVHELCDYADLLASSAPLAETSSDNVEPFVGSAVFLSPQETFVSSLTIESSLARGPPVLS